MTSLTWQTGDGKRNDRQMNGAAVLRARRYFLLNFSWGTFCKFFALSTAHRARDCQSMRNVSAQTFSRARGSAASGIPLQHTRCHEMTLNKKLKRIDVVLTHAWFLADLIVATCLCTALSSKPRRFPAPGATSTERHRGASFLAANRN